LKTFSDAAEVAESCLKRHLPCLSLCFALIVCISGIDPKRFKLSIGPAINPRYRFFYLIADPGTGRVCFRTNDTECFDLIEDKRHFVAKDSAAKNITIFRS